MLVFVWKKKRGLKISKFCIRIQFLKYLHCCLGFYLFSTIPQNGIISKPLYKESLLVKDAQNSGKASLGSTQSWVSHRNKAGNFSTSCHIPNTSGLLGVQELTPQITAPAGRAGVMHTSLKHVPFSLAIPKLLQSSPTHYRTQ